MIKKMLGKKIKLAGDLVYTVSATVVMQVALQLIIYPLINRFYGENVTGDILYFIGIVYIFPQAVGTAINNTRLVTRKTMDSSNGDYAGILASMSAITAVVCFAISYVGNTGIIFSLLFAIFSVVYTIRMYAQVEFRLRLNFRGYFIYYAITSVGYVIGFLLYMLTGIWLLIFFTGELIAIGYSIWKGDIFKKETAIGQAKHLYKTMSMILLSTLVRDGITQFDKVILRLLISAESVTHYNALSLVGKSVQMLVNPVNTLILSYLSAKEAKLSRKFFKKFLFCSLGVGIIMLVACQIATPIYIRLFYSSFYDEVMPYSLLVNSGLIMGFISMLFTALILSQGKTKTYTAIQTVWGVCYMIPAYFLTQSYGIVGLASVTLVVNTVKLIVTVVISGTILSQVDKQEKIKNLGVDE